MRRLFLIAMTGLLPLAGVAQTQAAADREDPAILVADTESDVAPATPDEEPVLRIVDAAEVELDEFLWVARIVAVLADTPNDPAFIQQLRDIEARAAELIERDVVVIIDSDRRSDSDLRRLLRPRGFMLAIIEKDGAISQRRPAPRDVREIAAIIDRFPLRRQEMLERRPSGR